MAFRLAMFLFSLERQTAQQNLKVLWILRWPHQSHPITGLVAHCFSEIQWITAYFRLGENHIWFITPARTSFSHRLHITGSHPSGRIWAFTLVGCQPQVLAITAESSKHQELEWTWGPTKARFSIGGVSTLGVSLLPWNSGIHSSHPSLPGTHIQFYAESRRLGLTIELYASLQL